MRLLVKSAKFPASGERDGQKITGDEIWRDFSRHAGCDAAGGKDREGCPAGQEPPGGGHLSSEWIDRPAVRQRWKGCSRRPGSVPEDCAILAGPSHGDRGLPGQLPGRRSAFKDELQRLVDEFTNFCQAILVLGECSPRALDAVGSIGERLCIRLLAASLNGAGVEAQPVDATRLIVTDDCFQAAHPDMEATSACTARELDPLLDKGIVPVVTGYIGATPSGVTTTLGRGGSDFRQRSWGLPCRQMKSGSGLMWTA